jgi:hypothetical protein
MYHIQMTKMMCSKRYVNHTIHFEVQCFSSSFPEPLLEIRLTSLIDSLFDVFPVRNTSILDEFLAQAGRTRTRTDRDKDFHRDELLKGLCSRSVMLSCEKGGSLTPMSTLRLQRTIPIDAPAICTGAAVDFRT